MLDNQNRPFRALLEHLGPEGMSSDESSDDELWRPTYKHLGTCWRSSELSTWLHDLDDGIPTHRRRRRKESPTQYPLISSSPAVKGLPRNCYNTRFLSSADEAFLAKVLPAHPIFGVD